MTVMQKNSNFRRRGTDFMPRLIKTPSGLRWVADAEWEEGNHPRDKDGKFASGAGALARAEKKAKRAEERRKLFASLQQRLANGEDPAKIVREGAKALQGTYYTELPEMGKTNVVFTMVGVRESSKYFKGRNGHFPDPYYRQAAERQLGLYENFEAILQTGARPNRGWRHQEDHHPDKEFLTITKRLPIAGKTRLATLDIWRDKAGGKAPQAHNTSTQGNPGFREKLKHWKDEAPVACVEVFSIRIE